MHILAYLLRRLLLLIPVLFGITIILFGITHTIGDPIAPYVTEHTPIAMYDAIRHREGLDLPIWQQYINYMFGWTRPNGEEVGGFLFGDWGFSNSFGGPVLEAVALKLPATAELAIFSMLMALAIGIPLGIYSSVNKDKLGDNISRVLALGGVSVPVFWLGLMCIYFLYFLPSTMGLPSLPHRGRLSDFATPPPLITGLYLVDTPIAIIDSLIPVTAMIGGPVVGIISLVPILNGGLLPDVGAALGNFTAALN
ncbi:MAG: ABC transporter permease, partial [Candidatus Odinarchaeota archaeon]